MVKNEKELYEVVGYLMNNFLDILNYTESFVVLGDFMNNQIVRRCYLSFSLSDEENTDLEQVVKRISGQLPIGFCVYPDRTIEDLKYVEQVLRDVVREDARYRLKTKGGLTSDFINSNIVSGVLNNKYDIECIEFEQC